MSEEIVLMKGNEAIAHAAIRYGVDGYFGYPITPQSEIIETLMEVAPWKTTGMWSCRLRVRWRPSTWFMAEPPAQICHDLLFQSRYQPQAGGPFLYGRSRAAGAHRERATRRPRTGYHSAIAGRLFPDGEGWGPWRLQADHAGTQLGAGDGRLCRTGFRTGL